MLSGAKLTETSRKHAEQMIKSTYWDETTTVPAASWLFSGLASLRLAGSSRTTPEQTAGVLLSPPGALHTTLPSVAFTHTMRLPLATTYSTPPLFQKAAEALPESLQSLIAARLDELPPECKTQLADAAVVGEVFWTGAVAALDHGDRQAAAGGLEDLRRRDLVQSRRDSSIVGECEFTFSHALIRDVAYGQLSRAARAVKHAAVARWVETEVGDHPGDVAEIIAHHYATALELAGLAGDGALVDELLAPTVRALELAGESALPLDVAAAERYFGRAVALAPSGMAGRPSLLVAWAEALAQGGDLSHAARLLDEGIEALVLSPFRKIGTFLWRGFDSLVIDGIANASAFLVELAGDLMRFFTPGHVRNYALAFSLGALFFVLYVWVR